ncbi:MAG: TraM recognition domain-containing protein [Haloplanus sp.]
MPLRDISGGEQAVGRRDRHAPERTPGHRCTRRPLAAERNALNPGYFANPDGRVLLLDYPLEEGNRDPDLFRVLLDSAIQRALADGDTQATFVLDEFARIPYIDRMDPFVATGRVRSIQSIVGVQSVSRLVANYRTDAADLLFSG